MGVTATRSDRRVYGMRRRATRRSIHRPLFPAVQPRTGRLIGRWGPVERTTLWDKLHDDRTLIGLKIVLLTFLFLLTALLEWAAA